MATKRYRGPTLYCRACRKAMKMIGFCGCLIGVRRVKDSDRTPCDVCHDGKISDIEIRSCNGMEASPV